MKRSLGIIIIIIICASMALPWWIWYGLGIDSFPWLVLMGNVIGVGFIVGIACHMHFYPEIEITDRMAEDMGLIPSSQINPLIVNSPFGLMIDN